MTHADAAARATLYTPDALMVRPGGWIVRGRAAVAEWLAANVNGPDEVTALEATQLTVEGNAARIEGRFRQRGRSAEAGRFQQVWVLVNGQWKLQQDLYSPGPVASDTLRQNQQ
jgi:ketosteroid isomerase-like protein